VAVDLYGAMVALAQKRTERKGVGDRVTFHVADVRNLPFADARFDAVLCESVLTFVAGKGRAIGELVRVVRPGGYVGLNEEIWFKTPLDEMVEFAKLAWGIETEILPPDGWRQHLEAAGLRDVVAQIHEMDVRRESSQIGRYDLGDLWNMFRRIVSLYVGDPALRRHIQKRRRLPRRFFQYLGYGIYAGRR
jgi:SAM-dependent methyltransferase